MRVTLSDIVLSGDFSSFQVAHEFGKSKICLVIQVKSTNTLSELFEIYRKAKLDLEAQYPQPEEKA